jgi:hypothetical protein
MKAKRFSWLTLLALGLLLVALPLLPALADEVEKKEPAPVAEKKSEATPEKPAAAERPAGLVGTVVAVAPASRTVVVDVPLGNDVLRIGAQVTGKTKITARGAAASFDSLKEGARVRIDFRRVATGDEVIALEVLRSPKG